MSNKREVIRVSGYNSTSMIHFRIPLLLAILLALLVVARPDDSIEASFVMQADEYGATFAYPPAADYIRVALERQPWNASLYLRSGAIQLGWQQFNAAARQFDLAEQAGADRVALASGRAKLAEQQQHFEEAAAQWSSVVRARPDDSAAARRLIAAYENAAKWTQARTAAEAWLTRDRTSAEAQLLLGQLIVLDDPAAAQPHFDQASSDQARPFLSALADPLAQQNQAYRSVLLGRAFLGQGDLPLAARAFLEATTAEPDYAEAFAYYGFTQDELGQDGQAALDRAVELDGDLIVARYFRARHAWLHGDLETALLDLKHAIERDPQNALVAVELGRVYAQQSDFANAEKWLTTARDLNPADAMGWKALAELYVGRTYGSPAQAVAVAQQAVALAPNDAEAHVWLGRADLLSGDLGGAERELRQAVKLDPRSAAAHFYLGRLLGRDSVEGRLEFERAIALDPNGPISAQANRMLTLP
jgi:Flp pilus assembly protein TadD